MISDIIWLFEITCKQTWYDFSIQIYSTMQFRKEQHGPIVTFLKWSAVVLVFNKNFSCLSSKSTWIGYQSYEQRVLFCNKHHCIKAAIFFHKKYKNIVSAPENQEMSAGKIEQNPWILLLTSDIQSPIIFSNNAYSEYVNTASRILQQKWGIICKQTFLSTGGLPGDGAFVQQGPVRLDQILPAEQLSILHPELRFGL